jgi:hypothetical protein
MKAWTYLARTALATAVAALCALAPSARAQPTLDADSQSVLAAMSQYVGGLAAA